VPDVTRALEDHDLSATLPHGGAGGHRQGRSTGAACRFDRQPRCSRPDGRGKRRHASRSVRGGPDQAAVKARYQRHHASDQVHGHRIESARWSISWPRAAPTARGRIPARCCSAGCRRYAEPSFQDHLDAGVRLLERQDPRVHAADHGGGFTAPASGPKWSERQQRFSVAGPPRRQGHPGPRREDWNSCWSGAAGRSSGRGDAGRAGNIRWLLGSWRPLPGTRGDTGNGRSVRARAQAAGHQADRERSSRRPPHRCRNRSAAPETGNNGNLDTAAAFTLYVRCASASPTGAGFMPWLESR